MQNTVQWLLVTMQHPRKSFSVVLSLMCLATSPDRIFKFSLDFSSSEVEVK